MGSTKDDGVKRRVQERLPSSQIYRFVKWLPTWLEALIAVGALVGIGFNVGFWFRDVVKTPATAVENSRSIDALKESVDSSNILLSKKIVSESQRLDFRIDSLRDAYLVVRSEINAKLLDLQISSDRIKCVVEAQALKQDLTHCGLR